MALLDALYRSAPSLSLVVAHLDHGLRGEESEADLALIRDAVARFGLPFEFSRANVMRLAKREGTSIEAAARNARYRFFGEVAERLGAAGIVTGHTADDQIETMLQRMVRGTGPAGLAGMSRTVSLPWLSGTPIPILRPLIEVDRAVTREYCREFDVPFRDDSSNDSTEFQRNRFRQSVVPLLRAENPSLSSAFNRLSTLLHEQSSFIQSQAIPAWNEIASGNDPIALPLEKLRVLHPILQQELIRMAGVKLAGRPQPIEAIHVELILKALRFVGHIVDLPGGLRASIVGSNLLIGHRQTPREAPEPITLSLGNSVDYGDWIISTRAAERSNWYESGDKLECLISYVGPITLRSRKPGDRYSQRFQRGTTKLQDLFVNEKIPREERPGWPVLEDERGIIWVPGFRISSSTYVPPGETCRWLHISARRRVGPEDVPEKS
jgi:tRNA(Ile)-lysidine synthase